MTDEKTRHTVWLTREGWEEVRRNYQMDGCRTQNEFIERAIHFYCGYLAAKQAEDFLPLALSTTLQGTLFQFGDRLGRLLFKLAVEIATLTRVVAFQADIGSEELEDLRGESVRDVKRTNGQLSFRDILRFRWNE